MSGHHARGPTDASDNRSTIAAYESCAEDYSRATKPKPGSDGHPALARFIESLPAGGYVLEIGSGPGWEADVLEDHGLPVRRTDAAVAFVDMQMARGVAAEVLDVVTDDLGGPYAGVVAQYVFQHVERSRLPGVFTKISRAIVEGGIFLFTLREGNSDLTERGETGGAYYVAEWAKPDLVEFLLANGLRECWATSSEDADGRWLTISARRAG